MKNFLTYEQLESLLMRLSKAQQSSIDPAIRKLSVNTRMFTIYSLLEGQNDRWYNRVATLTVVADAVSIASLYVKEIVRIYDDGGDYDIYTDAREFASASDDPMSDFRVGCYHFGDTIKFYYGRAVDGSVQIEYRGKPSPYTVTNGADGIDLPPEYNQQIIDECLQDFTPDVPKDVQVRLDQYAKTYDSAMKRKLEKEQKRENRE